MTSSSPIPAPRVAVGAAVIAALLGAAMLAAWLSASPDVIAWVTLRMKANSAVAMLAAALSVVCRVRGLDRLALPLALVTFAAGTLSLAEYATGLDLGIDQLIAVDIPAPESARFPGRMSPNAAVTFVLLGTALLSTRRAPRLAEAAGMVSAAVCLLALIGYLFDAAPLYQLASFLRISPYTAAGALILTIGSLALRPDVGLVRQIASPGPGGYTLRRLLVLVVVVPISIGYLVLLGEESGLIGTGAASALFAVATMGTLGATVVSLARALDASDARRGAVAAELARTAALTSNLSHAVTVEDVVEATIEHGLPALGSVSGALLLLAPDGRTLRTVGATGYAAAVLERYGTLDVDRDHVPVCDALRRGEPVYLSDADAFAREYPDVPPAQRSRHSSWAALPLRGRGRILGVLALSYGKPQPFDAAMRARLVTMASHCGQALDRALLFDSEKAARATVEAAGAAGQVGTWTLDARGAIFSADPFVAGVARLDAAEAAAGLPLARFLDAVHVGERARVAAVFDEALGQASDFETELRIGGDARWFTIRGIAERDGRGEVLRLSGALADITRRKLVEEQVRESEREKDEARALFDSVLATAPVGLAFLDRDLRYVRVNETLAALNGCAVEDHLGRSVGEVVGGELGQLGEQRLREILETGHPIVDQEVATERGDPPRAAYFLVSFYPVRDRDGHVGGIGAVVTDITERKRNEERAQRLQELTAVLAAAADDPDAVARLVVERSARAVGAIETTLLGDGDELQIGEDTVAVPFAGGGAVVWRFAASPERADIDFLHAVAQQCAQALERARLTAAQRAAAERLRILAEAGRAFAAEVELEPLLDTVARVVATALGPLATLELYAPGSDRPEHTAVHRAGGVLAVTRPPLLAEADDRAATVPLRSGGAIIGTLGIARDSAIAAGDRLLLEDLADRAAVAITSVRRRVEADAQRARLSAFFEQAQAIIVITRGPEHVLELSNPTHRATIGGRDVVGRPLREALPELADSRIVELLDRVLETGQPASMEAFAAQATAGGSDFSERFFDWVAMPLRDDFGRVDGVMSFATDVTEKVHALRAAETAREALAHTEERLRLALQGAAIGTFDWRPLEGTLRWDARCKELFGLPPEATVTYALFRAAIHPDDGPRVDEEIARALDPRSGGGYDTEHRAIGVGDGVERWVRSMGQVMFGEDDQPTRFVGTVIDITEQKRTQLALKTAGERLAAALEAGSIGTYFWDMRAGTVAHDAGVKAIFGFGPDVGDDLSPYTARIHPDDQPAWAAALDNARQHGTDVELRYRVVLPDGTTRTVLDKGRVGRDDKGVPASLTGAVVDLTAETRAREAAEAANRAKDEFMAMLGHELRNPLSPILTALSLMKLRAGESLAKERAIIERQVQHMVRLVDDLLDVSRITRGKVELKRRRVELAQIVAKAVELASPLLEKRKHRLSTRVAPHGIPLFVDEERITQVVANLLTNAAKFTEPGGAVEVRGARHGDLATIEVEDTGSGIAPELLPRVFDLFVQGQRTIDRAQGGLGLGLSIVRTLVEMHGGAVRAHSDGPGKGSTFTVLLPIAAEAADAAQPSAGESPPLAAGPRRRVLVVDDNRDAAEALAEGLRIGGHEVAVAFDGPTALRVAADLRPELAFLDIGLPVMDGYELARRLREQTTGQRLMLVALTGYGLPSDRARSAAAGFDRHLVKPIELDRMLGLAASLGA